MSSQVSELTDGILSLVGREGFSTVEAHALNTLVTLVQGICTSAHRPIVPVAPRLISQAVTAFNDAKNIRIKTMEDYFWSFSTTLFKSPLGRLAVKHMFGSINNRAESKDTSGAFDSLGGLLLGEPFDIVQGRFSPEKPSELEITGTEVEDTPLTHCSYGFRNCNVRPDFTRTENEYVATPEQSVSSNDDHIKYTAYGIEDLSDSSDKDESLPMIQTEPAKTKQSPPWHKLAPDLIEEPAVCILCDSLMTQFSKAPSLPTMCSQFDKIEPFLIPPPAASHRAFGGYGDALNQLLDRNCQLGT